MKHLIYTISIFISLQIFSVMASAEDVAGKVIFSSGINKVINSAGQSRVVKRGDIVNSGDRLKTTTGRMQVRFTDKGFVSIKPGSELLIQEYKFSGQEDGSENAIFNLLRGSIRAVSGLIGRTNKQAYQYRTPVATIGIRGTAFVLSYCNGDCFDASGVAIADGLYVNNGEGKVILTSNGGSMDLVRGQFAHVRNRNSAPRQILRPPAIREQIQSRIERYDFREVIDTADHVVPLDNTVQRSGFVVNVNDLSDRNSFSDVFGTAYNTLARPAHGMIANVEGDTVVFLETGSNGLSRMTGYGQRYNFFDTDVNANREFVDTFVTTATAQGTFGGSGQLGVIWGTWETGWQNVQQAFDENGNLIAANSGSTNAATDRLYHYILSNNLTPIDTNGHYQGLNTRVVYGSTTAPTLGGQVAYINSNSTSGLAAIYGNQSVFLDVDFSNGVLHALDIAGQFPNGAGATAGYTASLDPAAGIQSIYASSFIRIMGDCSAGLCGAALSGYGSASVDFLGPNAGAAMGSYGLAFLDNTVDHYVGGTYLISQNQAQTANTPTTPAATGITGIAIASAGTYVTPLTLGNESLSANTEDGSLLAVNVDPGGANITAFNVNNSVRDGGVPATSRTQFNALAINGAISPGIPPSVLPTSQGNDPALRVSWGYWMGDYEFQNEAGTARYNNSTAPMHFIYSDNITPDANVQALSTVVTYDNFIGGNVTYQNISLGAEIGSNVNGSMDVDFATANINAFTLTADFIGGTDTINLSGQGAGFAARSFDVQTTGGFCNACGGVTGTLTGKTNYEFLGPNAEGVAGTLYLDDGTHSITGSFVMGTSAAPAL